MSLFVYKNDYYEICFFSVKLACAKIVNVYCVIRGLSDDFFLVYR